MSAVERLNAALSGRYRIERELGEGGMATVYLADDLRHERKVALKVLKPELAAVVGADRFLAEIKTTANLQHPHILALYDSGEADGFLYYVMPYIDGESLRERLERETQLPVEEAVRIATDVAEALHAAHEQGVIHRDIKPANILLSRGRPLVADFGIALAVSAAGGGRLTETGLSMGTPYYMSPEQASADREPSAASDVYSLGCVLYELLVGDPPHTASSAQAVLAKILTEEAPGPAKARASIPPHVDAAIRKSLEKLPADRFTGGAAAFARALEDESFRHGSPAEAAIAKESGWSLLNTVTTSIAVVAILFAAFASMQPPSPQPVTRLQVPVSGGHAIGAGFFPNLAVSPDGRTIVYGSEGRLFKRDMDRSDPEPIPGTEGACCPVFSPDGTTVLFSESETTTHRVGVTGGTVTELASFSNEGASWSLPGQVTISGFFEGIDLLDPVSGTRETLTVIDSLAEGDHMWPQLVDDGRYLVFTVLAPNMLWSGASVVVEDLEAGTRAVVAHEATFGRYVSTGHVLVARADGTLEAIPFDLEAMEVTGEGIGIDTGVRVAYWGGAASYAVSEGGTLAYVRGSTWENHRLVWYDRSGARTGVVGDPMTVENLELAPDGRSVVTYLATPGADVWRVDLTTGDRTRLTFDATTEDRPMWSPDGRWVAFRRLISGRDHRLVAISMDGVSADRELYSTDRNVIPHAWSPDGQWVVLLDGEVLRAIAVAGDRSGDVIDIAEDGWTADLSPDGDWLVYQVGRGDVSEIHAVAFPSLGARRQIASSGAREPRWSAESGEIFFLQGDTMMVTRMSLDDGLSYDRPQALWTIPSGDPRLMDSYDVTSDGQRFLFPEENPDAPAKEIHVVLNWLEELRRADSN